jgi:hypothetical protein
MTEPPVSDHYLVRWLERNVGVDIDALRIMAWAELAPGVQEAILSFPQGAADIKGGGKAVWKRHKLVTYLPPDCGRYKPE